MGKEKLKSLEELSEIVARFKGEGLKVVFTNGCFDILHVGHVRLLAAAKTFGDILIVGLNSDSSVKRLKGEKRPIVSGPDRAEVLSAIESVDYVVLFEEDTPVRVIGALKPHVHVKGGDYDLEKIPEAEVVRSYGGELRAFSLVDGRSSTDIIEKIGGTLI
ncbi:MAG: D-glycero-beta-D-manno-heptose 1-phosphate adenylyltransferase [Candidatus Eremiobacteraeota bacterium]|nr:D-glycero-beta-D-manno-heptose 1-phosphate adenylyltransferase [Candidatus Eremiobacteraeota bacterium]